MNISHQLRIIHIIWEMDSQIVENILQHCNYLILGFCFHKEYYQLGIFFYSCISCSFLLQSPFVLLKWIFKSVAF